MNELEKKYNSLLNHLRVLEEQIVSSSRIEEILQQIARIATEVLLSDPVIIFQYDAQTSKLIPPVFYAGELFEKDNFLETIDLAGNSFVEKVAAGGQSIYFENLDEIDNIDKAWVGFYTREQIKSMAALILQAEDEIVGLMYLNYRSPKIFAESLKKLMTTFTSYAAIIIKNRKLIENLRAPLADFIRVLLSPLHNIVSHLGALKYYMKKTFGDDRKVDKIIKIIEEEIIRVKQHMLNAGSLEEEPSESRQENFEKGHICDTVTLCANSFFETASKRNIKIIINDSVRNLPEIYYHKMQMEQVFMNLIENAVNYSHPNQNIEISGDNLGLNVAISIKDIGVEIQERHYGAIFEGFSPSPLPGQRRGLRIAKKNVENHKGKIIVNSKPYYKDRNKSTNPDGYTTTFIVMLPKHPKV
jgi:signal transduction histidine kinase